jgi:hypothetical protein
MAVEEPKWLSVPFARCVVVRTDSQLFPTMTLRDPSRLRLGRWPSLALLSIKYCLSGADNDAVWCRVRGSNPRPSVYKTAALPLC